MVSLCHRPVIWMVMGSTLAMKRAMAPVARRLRAETSAALRPREGPKKVTACLIVEVRWRDVRFSF